MLLLLLLSSTVQLLLFLIMLFLYAKHVLPVRSQKEEECLREQFSNLDEDCLAETSFTVGQAGEELGNECDPVPHRGISLEVFKGAGDLAFLVVQTEKPEDAAQQLA